jgi:hypothetical protein
LGDVPNIAFVISLCGDVVNVRVTTIAGDVIDVSPILTTCLPGDQFVRHERISQDEIQKEEPSSNQSDRPASPKQTLQDFNRAQHWAVAPSIALITLGGLALLDYIVGPLATVAIVGGVVALLAAILWPTMEL